MLQQFTDIDVLMKAVETDKSNPINGAFVADRYPIRFVLFDNFRDCREFVSRQTSKSLYFQSIDLWLNKDSPDEIVYDSNLAVKILNYCKN